MNDFNLQKFLIENKMTRNSKLLIENQMLNEDQTSDFLNQHKDEVFEKIVSNIWSDLSSNQMKDFSPLTDDRDETPYTCATSDFDTPEAAEAGVDGPAIQARFEPFPEENDYTEEDGVQETTIGGRKIYYLVFEY